MPQPRKFRKKPVVIEAMLAADAVKAAATAWPDLPTWMTDAYENGSVIFLSDAVLIHTLEGAMRAELDDWIIRGTRDELYPCKPGPFADTFEPVTSDADGHTCAPHGRTTEADCPACRDAEQALAEGETHL